MVSAALMLAICWSPDGDVGGKFGLVGKVGGARHSNNNSMLSFDTFWYTPNRHSHCFYVKTNFLCTT
jgi:hypothetical protein